MKIKTNPKANDDGDQGNILGYFYKNKVDTEIDSMNSEIKLEDDLEDDDNDNDIQTVKVNGEIIKFKIPGENFDEKFA